MAAYDCVLQKALTLDRKGIFLGLNATQNALKVLHDPQKKFPSVLIAGTNGKGSTVAMLSFILKEAGYRVGTFISPHLLDIRERIQFDGKMVSKRDFLHAYEKIETTLQQNNLSLSFFEFMTVMFVWLCAIKKVDIAVVEVGLGGRLDATNVLDPLISIITTIGFDHKRFLGKTLKAIATEKAGIMRKHVPVILGVTQPHIKKHLKLLTKKKGTKSYFLGEDFFISREKKRFHFVSQNRKWSNVEISLLGQYQKGNVACVLQAIQLLQVAKWNISETALRNGLKKTRWPGRLEIVQNKPRVILDGAHNLPAMKALIASLKNDFSYHRLHIVFGVMADKDYRPMMERLLEISDSFHFVVPEVKRALTQEKLLKTFPEISKKIHVYAEVASTLPEVMKTSEPDDLICVTGSLYTVAEAKRLFV